MGERNNQKIGKLNGYSEIRIYNFGETLKVALERVTYSGCGKSLKIVGEIATIKDAINYLEGKGFTIKIS